MKWLLLLSLVGCVTNKPEYTICHKCPPINVFQFPEETTRQDELAIRQAKKTCERKGKCLVKFTVVEHGRYHAICGAKEEMVCKIEME